MGCGGVSAPQAEPITVHDPFVEGRDGVSAFFFILLHLDLIIFYSHDRLHNIRSICILAIFVNENLQKLLFQAASDHFLRCSSRSQIEVNASARISNRRSGRPDLDGHTALISNETLNAAERLGFQI